MCPPALHLGWGPGTESCGHSFSLETTGLLSGPHRGLWLQVVEGMSLNGGVQLVTYAGTHALIHPFGPLGRRWFKNSDPPGPHIPKQQGCVRSAVGYVCLGRSESFNG